MFCRLVKVSGFLLLLACAPVMALDNDRQQPIYIESDELEVDDQQGVSEYRGAVRFTQGSIHLQADKVVVIEMEQRLHKVIAYGQPVHLRQSLDDDKGEMRAMADKIEYLVKDDSLVLHGSAKLWQRGNEFSGEEITYHLSTETVVAHSDKEQEGRVRIVIQPKTEAKDPATDVEAGPP